MSNSKSWIVVKNKPNQDKIALMNLERQNFEVFWPTFQTTSRIKNKFKKIVKPVFPGYVFVAISPEEENWYKINHTKGISRIIAFGTEIPFLDYRIIEELKHRFSKDSIRKAPTSFEVGLNVKITNGPFTPLFGKIDKIDSDQRIWILLNILGTQTRVSVDKMNLIT